VTENLTTIGLLESQQVELEDEMNLKSGENNRLRKQVTDLQATVNDLYRSRKGPGTDKIQMDAIKADNDMLIKALKDTAEYADLEDAEIIKAAKTLN
jgi:hypothetical protein